FGVLFLVGGIRALAELPPFGEPLMRIADSYVQTGLEQTGAANVVAAIILDFRGYDTLGEATVLFTAVVGVLTVMRRTGRRTGKGD
ncbi:MAG: hydrogen gas-evolving membrane-bound hydrogenase subunit E, partial [candidate division WOR-3 bacterium]